MYDPIKDLQENIPDFYKELKEIFEKLAWGKLDPAETEDCFHDWLMQRLWITNDIEAQDTTGTIVRNIAKGVIHFDSKQKFVAYLKTSMNSWIIDYLRIKSTVIKRFPEGKRNRETLPSEDVGLPDDIDKGIFQKEAKEIFQSLTLENKLLISLYILRGITLEGIADLLHIPRSTVHYRLKKVKEKIDTHLEGKFNLPEEKNGVVKELSHLLDKWWEVNRRKW